MKNTTGKETSYALVPSLRVAFKNEEVVEVKVSNKVKSKKQREKIEAAKTRKDLPLFDEYRRKAKDHDPL